MMNVVNKPVILVVIMLSVIMLSVIMLSVIMANVTSKPFTLSVVMLNVVAPFWLTAFWLTNIRRKNWPKIYIWEAYERWSRATIWYNQLLNQNKHFLIITGISKYYFYIERFYKLASGLLYV